MRGPLLLLAALALFAVLDANSKLLSGGYHVSQVLAFRYAVLLGLLVLARLVWRNAGGGLESRRPMSQLLRAGFMVGSGTGFFMALRSLPLAEGYLVYFTAPFMLLALFRVLLKEPVPASTWGWCGVGFLGVLTALWPGLSVGGSWPAYAWALLGAFCHAMVLVMNRSLRNEPGVARLVFWGAAPALPALMPWALAEWVTPSWPDAIALSANGVLAGGAMLALAAAFRHASAGRLAPLEFSALIYAVVLDVAVWGVWPSAWVWAGAAIVAFAGIMAQRRGGH
ncbi:DMT family transporter [Roseomonas xinghualingensis]|uniref:DMT family transporter n=1 Tax=Roseomonas xinghualingensis TaxID=2986475 RepID=UPI0021F24741|nr:DMT family transporter [Roseomonas sp. SXEYE001]MCV4206611.1 DMT family transporter [Roseomonas sp. SXEYE001]